MRPKILIVEDDPSLRKALGEELSVHYEVETAGTVAQGREAAIRFSPDVALLDVELPDGSGKDLCAELRSHPCLRRTKVIMLTGQLDAVADAFNNGADDYISKPFRMAELRARIGSKMRRLEEQGALSEGMGNLRIDASRMAAVIGGEETVFSQLEFSLLRFFLERPEKIASRQAILSQVWAGVVVTDRAVDAHIVSLRRKIEKFDHEIATVYGAGYMLRKRKAQGSAEI